MHVEDVDRPLTNGKAAVQMMDGAHIGKIRRPRIGTQMTAQLVTNGRKKWVSRRMAELIRLLLPYLPPTVEREEGRIMVAEDPDFMHPTSVIGVEKAAIICIQ
eukprot:2977644-Karenia_brevis.AAC.1